MYRINKKFKSVQKFPHWLTWFGAKMMFGLRKLMRVEIVDPNGLFPEYLNSPSRVCIVTLWHNRLLMLPTLFPYEIRKRTVAVISASRDGQYLVDFIAEFGVKAVRGSSKRRAVSVLLDAIKTIDGGCLLVFTPDGPRGPMYYMNKGPIYVASKIGVPIIPVGINYSSFWKAHSWDGFRVPKPWSRIKVVIGNEMLIPPDLSEEEFEHWRLKATEALNEVSLVDEENMKK